MMDNMLFLPKCREWINFWEISSISATLFFVRGILLVITSLVQSRMTAVHASVSSSRSFTVFTSEFLRRTSLISAIYGDLRSARALHSTRKWVLSSRVSPQSRQSGFTWNWLNLALWACRMYDPVMTCNLTV